MLPASGSPDEAGHAGRARRPRPRRRRPTTSRRCSSTPARSRSRVSSPRSSRSPSGSAARAAARGTRSRRTTRSRATCSRRRTRSPRRSRRCPADAPGGDEPVPAGAYDALEDELGDLLFQVVIHSVLAREAGAFTIADVARGIHTSSSAAIRTCSATSRSTAPTTSCATGSRSSGRRRGPTRSSPGSPRTCPRCCYVQKLFRKAESIGLDPAAGTSTGPATRSTSASGWTPDGRRSRPWSPSPGNGDRSRVGAARVGPALPRSLRGDGGAGGSRRASTSPRAVRRTVAALWAAVET